MDVFPLLAGTCKVACVILYNFLVIGGISFQWVGRTLIFIELTTRDSNAIKSLKTEGLGGALD